MKRKTYVYIMQANRYVKIGVSRNPDVRRKTMQTGNPNKIMVIALFPFGSSREAYEEEKRLHEYLANFNVYGEWFSAKCLKVAKKYNQGRSFRHGKNKA